MELNFKSAKILLVDDDENYGFALKTLLGSKGLEINSFTNPKEALAYLRSNDTDIILLDYYMPEMTGEEFLKKFREFNNETIVFLQTAFSEEKPELEMLKTLNIQGYIDKNKDPNEIFLEIFSGIKMSELMKKVRKQEKQLDAQEYRNQFLGKFLNMLMGEIKEKSFSMVGNILALEELTDVVPADKRELYSRSISNIKNATEKLNQLIKSLELDSKNITILELKNILKNLFDVIFSVKDIKLNLKNNTDNEYLTISADVKVLVYILVDIIEYLIENEEKEINILFEKENDILSIKICNNIENEELINKIKKLAMFDQKVEVMKEFSYVVINIK